MTSVFFHVLSTLQFVSGNLISRQVYGL